MHRQVETCPYQGPKKKQIMEKCLIPCESTVPTKTTHFCLIAGIWISSLTWYIQQKWPESEF